MDFRRYPDLAVRTLGGSVRWATDEAFAERENLIKPGPAVFDPAAFGHKGKVYDGWETRRRRVAGHDEAVVRLGAPGLVRGVVVDTAWFKGNFPPQASVEGLSLDGDPGVDELRAATWEPLVPVVDLKGDAENAFAVDSGRRWTHVRLTIHPDGGVARLRVHGEPVPDPRVLDAFGTLDLAATEHGGLVVGCSDMFYGSPSNLIAPGLARSMGEGWETARRRDDGNDWVVVQLAEAGVVRVAEVDTSYFLGNAPGAVLLRGRDEHAGDDDWLDLLARTPLQPDTRHRFLLPAAPTVTQVRLDIFPDGGLSRLRLVGSLARPGRERLCLRWFNALPAGAARRVLREDAGLAEPDAEALLAARPLRVAADLPSALRGPGAAIQ